METPIIQDNPILTKHVRSRLRRPEPMAAAFVTLVLCAFLTYITTSKPASSHDRETAFAMLLVVQGIVLFLMGTGQVFGALFRAKESNILDFHRISPLSALTLTAGFLFGAPVREYMLFALTLPFSLYTGVVHGGVSLPGWVLITVCTVVAAVLYHLAAMMLALLVEKGKTSVGASALVVFTYMLASVPPVKYLTILPVVALATRGPLAFDDLWHGPVGDFLLACLHQAVLIVFLLLAVCRRMRSEYATYWPKPVAVVFYLLLSRLAMLDLQQSHDLTEVLPLLMLYLLVGIGLFLVFAVTPPARDFLRGLRRAHKLGRPGLGGWADAAPNWWPLLAFCVLLAVSMGLVQAPADQHVAAASLAAALVLFYYGCALQSFLLRYKNQARPLFLVLLFCLWIVPLLLGGILGVVHNAEGPATLVASLSPLAGLGLMMSDKTAYCSGLVLGVNAILAIYFVMRRVRDEKAARKITAG